jgi:hypothetical protein
LLQQQGKLSEAEPLYRGAAPPAAVAFFVASRGTCET